VGGISRARGNDEAGWQSCLEMRGVKNSMCDNDNLPSSIGNTGKPRNFVQAFVINSLLKLNRYLHAL